MRAVSQNPQVAGLMGVDINKVISFTFVIGAALGAVAGVLIVDYWVLRKTELDLRSLYVTDGNYRYSNGWNVPAAAATILGSAIALLGAFWEPMRVIYDFSWFVGFGVAGGLYYALMRHRV